ncbi:DUF6668 family protein [Streptomyces capillispiralis]|uniref:Uncharacterized protein n=1 Tax=Streptomyces capillispiralis TaxID=68182 RepID=A0A561TFK1_9ACTN|nr:DUF6668 family protein [Streptomyces capillispiralis]TWF85871.1 hypothetical protein FHX78_112828 [Streptomyces capillispiralis]GHH89655.1 hypothetical protein GCM10017779_01650 [Streptomyces capillispiralis]
MRTSMRQGPEIWIRGPVAVPEAAPPEPARPRATARRFSWVGLHGGAGVTTLATVYGGHDGGRAWPGPADPRSVLLVARTHAAGLDAVVPAVELFRRGEAPSGLDLDAVVLVADAPGRLPRPLVQRVRLIESVVDVYRVPWVSEWRLGDLGGRPPRETEPLARLTGAPL